MSVIQRAMRSLTVRAKLTATTAVLVAVIAGIMALSAHSTSVSRGSALVNNVAGRQPMLVDRYLKEVILKTNGFMADPAGTADTLTHTADALLDGGAVLAVQGNDNEVHIPAQNDPAVRAKLEESSRLIHLLIASGESILDEKPGTAAYQRNVASAEALSNVTSNVGHDAVGRMTTVAEAAVLTVAYQEIVLAAFGILLALLLSWMLGKHLVMRLRALAEIAKAAAAGNRNARSQISNDDEVSALGSAFNEMADNVSALIGKLEAEAERDSFGSELVEAFEMADDEIQAHDVIERAMTQISASSPMELLLADSSRAHLQRVARAREAGSPGCPVESPFACAAVRRGSTVVFESSESLNACPKLRDRPSGPCSAVCVPVSFMGKSLGVLHATAADGRPLGEEAISQMNTLATQAGSRIGTIRAFKLTQLQATTDGLTGLINRRTLENALHDMMNDGKHFALAMADLDHFKQLNDKHGHEGGDRALRMFTETMRAGVREGDLVARYGGEEFVLVFPGATALEAEAMLDRLRVMLAAALSTGETPTFTASFGVTDSRAARSAADLIRIADDALMKAKASGRNRVVVAGAREASTA